MFFDPLLFDFIVVANGYIFNGIDKPKGWSSIHVGLDPINHKQKPSKRTKLLVKYY
jgi:hypothetical protein